MAEKIKNIPQLPLRGIKQNIENESKPKYELGVRDEILAQRQVEDNLLDVILAERQANEQASTDDNGTQQPTEEKPAEQQAEFTVSDDSAEQFPYVVNIEQTKDEQVENNDGQHHIVENNQETEPNNKPTESDGTDENGGNTDIDGSTENSNTNTPTAPSPAPTTPSPAPTEPTPPPITPTSNENKGGESAGNNKKKEERPKTELNKHALRFVGLLLATWAIFLVNPVLMFLALMVFEASFIMRAIELNPNSRLAKWARKEPKTLREKQDERMMKAQAKMNKYALSSEQISELSSLRAKGFRHLKPREMFKRMRLAGRNWRFNRASNKFNSIYNTYHYDDQIISNAKDLINTQSNDFNNLKNNYIEKLNNNIQNRERMLELANDGDIKLTNDQMTTLQNEIKDLGTFKDQVNTGFVNTIGDSNNQLLEKISKQPYNKELYSKIVEHTNENEWNASLQDYLNESNISKPSLSSVYSEVCQSSNFSNAIKNKQKTTTNTNANTNINDFVLK